MARQFQQLYECVHSLAKVCKHFVVCPGSRNAPIIKAIAQQLPLVSIYSHIDERAAAYFALGLAKQIQAPVAVVCTSGSAVLNFLPAIAEAFYQHIGLIAITADRPTNANIGFDNQAINQQGVFGNFVQTQTNLDFKQFDYEKYESIVNTINYQLPWHINIHLNEPLYDFTHKKSLQSNENQLANKKIGQEIVEPTDALKNILAKAKKTLVFLGFSQVSKISGNYKLPIIADTCSADFKHANIYFYEHYLSNQDIEHPDLLITSGSYMLSKKLRQWLTKNPPSFHLHLSDNFEWKSAFTPNCDVSNCDINLILSFFSDNKYYQQWQKQEQRVREICLQNWKKNEFLALNGLKHCLQLAKTNVIHCGNSMAVRLVALIQNHFRIFDTIICNRGTSGIDGCLSTFFGSACASNKQEWLLIGDVSFFYDCNAFWATPLPKSFAVIVINNAGGKIFELLEGSQNMGDSIPYLVTPHQKSVKHIAAMHHINYIGVENMKQLFNIKIPTDGQTIIEIFDENLMIENYRSLISDTIA